MEMLVGWSASEGWNGEGERLLLSMPPLKWKRRELVDTGEDDDDENDLCDQQDSVSSVFVASGSRGKRRKCEGCFYRDHVF